MTATLVESAPRLGDALTARELQVVRLVAEGRSNPEVGKILKLSPLTAKRHMQRIGEKLGTGDRAGIVAQTYRTGQLSVVRSGDVEFEERLTAVLLGIARGLSNAEIAAVLFVAETTVKSRVLVLFRLLGVHDRAAAVKAGLECGAISLVPRRPARTPVHAAGSAAP